MTGQSIAHYRITAKLGEGGMGTVYRATDPQLDRDVAIKVLPESFAQDKERLARFEREAKALAALNHPNIAAIYGLERSGDAQALVLELVEGEDLSERLKRGALPVEQALDLCRQIAEALEAAHEKDIIHRDLKPGNVKLTPGGKVKVLDFGLAKAAGAGAVPCDPNAATLIAETTMPGAVMGTPAYMSPEQARGEAVDRRTDVWAFGCCLYECLTGAKPFRGASATDLLAAVLRSEPDWDRLPAETPREINTLLRRCLEKDPRRRLSDLGDIAILLDESMSTSRRPAAPAAQVVTTTQPGTSRRNWAWPVAAALGAALLVAGFFLWRGRVAPVTGTAIRTLAVLPFENLKKDDNDSQYLAATFQDALKEQLGALGQLVIKAQESAGVDATVRGTFVREDDVLRVSVSMIDASQSVEPLGIYTRQATNIFQLWDEIAISVAEKIRGRLTAQERDQMTARSNVPAEAYLAFRRGQYYLDAGSVTDHDKIRREFEKSLRLAPTFVDPIIGLADLELKSAVQAPTLQQSKIAVRKARAYLDEAKVLAEAGATASNLSKLEGLDGWLALMGEFRWLEAGQAIRRAVRTDPNNAESHQYLGWYLALVECRYEEGLDAMRDAIALDPERYLYRYNEGSLLRYAGRSKESIAIFRKLSAEKADSWSAIWSLGSALHEAGDLKAARVQLEKAVQLSKRDPRALRTLAQTLAALADRSAVQTILTELMQREDTEYVPAVEIACVQGVLGEWDSALTYLETAFDQKQGGSFIYSMRNPEFMRLFQDQPGFWELTDRLGFPGLPLGHLLYDKEREMRYGKGGSAAASTAANAPR